MRTRLIALLILISIICLPALAYWYFIASSTVGVEISSDPRLDFSLSIEGTFQARYLPLADQLIERQISCSWSCLVELPPALYTITATAEWQESSVSELRVVRGSRLTHMIHFESSRMITRLDSSFAWTPHQSPENPRFSLSIDLDDHYRLGYIASSDAARLSLQNLPLWHGVLILYDRTTASSRILRSDLSIRGFVSIETGGVGYQDEEGVVWRVE